MNTVSHTLDSHSWRVDIGGRDDTRHVFQTSEFKWMLRTHPTFGLVTYLLT